MFPNSLGFSAKAPIPAEPMRHWVIAVAKAVKLIAAAAANIFTASCQVAAGFVSASAGDARSPLVASEDSEALVWLSAAWRTRFDATSTTAPAAARHRFNVNACLLNQPNMAGVSYPCSNDSIRPPNGT